MRPIRSICVPASSLFVIACIAILLSQGCTSKINQAAVGRREGASVPVVVATVSQKDVPVNIDVIGNVEAYSTISVKAQIGGELTKVSFHEGEFVKKGDLLFTVDPRPYAAALSQMEANVTRDVAALRQAEANLARDAANEKYAQSQAARYQKLFEERVVSKEQTDQMRSSADALEQTILADRASIARPRAQIG